MTTALTETQIGADRALALGSLVLVASKSHPGTWHRVAFGGCDCAGYRHRNTCRHLAVAAAAEHHTEVLAQLAPGCTRCGRPARLRGGLCSRCLSSTPDD
jgi:hypothetical protein